MQCTATFDAQTDQPSMHHRPPMHHMHTLELQLSMNPTKDYKKTQVAVEFGCYNLFANQYVNYNYGGVGDIFH